MNRGYAGYYKGVYLRSSYEYAYAIYLEYLSIEWSYETEVFDIGYKFYKPDFFFYDENNELIKIVEVKSRNSKEKDKAKEALKSIEEIYNIECELISYGELLGLYKSLPFSLTSTINYWINSKDTSVNKAYYGELNGHFNRKHSEETKRKIGAHTKKLWATDSVSKRKMYEGLRKSGMVQKGKHKKTREKRNCEECAEVFEVITTSHQKFCSNTCSGNSAIRNATNVYISKRAEIHEELRSYIIQWTKENKEIVLDAPYNRIKTTIKPLIDNIEKQFGVKDFRVISKSVFGKDLGRKELLRFMKDICDENVC